MDVLVPSSQPAQATREYTTVNPFTEFVQESFQENFGRMLTIQSFVSKTQFNIDPLFFDEQWTMRNTQRSDEKAVFVH